MPKYGLTRQNKMIRQITKAKELRALGFTVREIAGAVDKSRGWVGNAIKNVENGQ